MSNKNEFLHVMPNGLVLKKVVEFAEGPNYVQLEGKTRFYISDIEVTYWSIDDNNPFQFSFSPITPIKFVNVEAYLKDGVFTVDAGK